MAKIFEVLHNEFSPLVNGQKSSANIEGIQTLYETILEFTKADDSLASQAEILAQIDTVSFSQGGVPIFPHMPVQFWLDVQTHYAEQNEEGYLTLYHYLPYLELLEEKIQMGFGTLNSKVLTVEFRSKTLTTITSARLLGEVSNTRRTRGGYLRWVSTNRNANSDKTNITNLGWEGYDGNRVVIAHFLNVVDIENMNFEINDSTIMKEQKIQRIKKQLTDAGRGDISARWTVIDFNRANRAQDFLTLDSLIEKAKYVMKTTAAPVSFDLLELTIEDANFDN